MTTFPYGYAGDPAGMGTQLTWDQMMTKATVVKLNPEVQRRFKALIERAAAEGVPLGCGTGWRVQPNKPGFAKPGNSYHEGFPADGVSGGAMAIDTVPKTSWDWMEANCGAYGFRTFRFVNNEPWHIQPVEISASRNWATKSPKIPKFNLPGNPPLPEGKFVVNLLKTELTPERREEVRGNEDVLLVQFISLGLFKYSGNAGFDVGMPDADYGPRTQDAVRLMQAINGLTQDACCGPKTWTAILNSDGK